MATGANDWTGLTISGGRYVVKSKLGEGGMGVVYCAHDVRLDIDVVIKVPRRAMLEDPEFAGRFAREIRSLVRLSHPCIVKVTDVGQYQALPFAIMQYLPGGSLEDRQLGAAERPVPADPRSVTGWLPGIASALDYIHSQGYIHRDVKPGNILFDSQGHAFLGDFGVIKTLAAAEVARSKTVTTAGLVLGTPEYMAPELIMGGHVDGRADQYALAVTVYETICGRRPFAGPSASAVVVLHTTQPPPPLTDHAPGLPGAVSAAVLRGLNKNAADRFPSCAAFAEAVAAALAANPGFAAPTPPSGTAYPESVKLRCPSCRKTVGLSRSMYGNLKRSQKSITCPGCGAPIPVEETRTKVLDATPPGVGGIPASPQPPAAPVPGSTTLLPVANGPGLARPPVHATEKIAIDHLTQAEDPDTGACYRVQTQVLAPAALPVLPRVEEEPPPPANSSWLLWVGSCLAAVLLTAILAYVLRPRGFEPTSTPAEDAAPGTVELVEVQPADQPSVESQGAGPANSAATPVVTSAPLPQSVAAPTSPRAEAVPIPVASSARRPVVQTLPGHDGDAPGATPNPNGVVELPPGKINLAADHVFAYRDRFAGRVVIPVGLYRVTSRRSSSGTGLAAIAVTPGVLVVQQDGAIHLATKGKTADLPVSAELAARLPAAAGGDGGTRGGPGAGTVAGSESVAILNIRVAPAAPWACEVVKVEFLTHLDFVSIGQDNFPNAFQTLTISAAESRLGAADGEEWRSRVGLHFANMIKVASRTVRNEATMAKWAAYNRQIGAMIDSSVQNAAAANAAAENARSPELFSK